MMKRLDWQFEYGVEEVMDAARERAAYHRRREDFWTDERQEALTAIQETGVDVREFDVTGGKKAQVVIDPTLSERLNECQAKLATHQDQAEKYEGWTHVLRATVDRGDAVTLKLDHEDVRYFGLDQVTE
jgi:hypothetical protein